MTAQPETRFKTKVINILDTLRPAIYYIKIQQKTIIGTPDIFICASGKFVAWELKVGSNKASRLQEYNLDCIDKAGGIARVVTPDNLDKCLKELYGIIKEVKAKSTC